MNILRHFGVALASVMITACCCAQSLLASATGTGQNLAFSRNITGNFTPVTGVTAAESGDSTVSEQPPDAPSARQTEAGFEKAKPAFEAPNFEDTLTANANAYDSTSPAASTGKLVRMISGIMRRFVHRTAILLRVSVLGF